MPNQHQSVIYTLGVPDNASPTQLIHVEEHPDALAAVYINPLEMRSPAVWDVNWLTRHQMGHSLWQQSWTADSHEGRVQESPQGLRVAVARWEIRPASQMPRGVHVVPVERRGHFVWHIRSGFITQALCDTVNTTFERIVGDALWVQRWHDYQERFASSSPALPTAPSSEVLHV